MIASTTALQNVKDASRNSFFVVVALASVILTPSILAQTNITSTSGTTPIKHILDDVRRSVAHQLVSTLKDNGIKQLAVTKIYYNGSSIDPVSAFIQRKVVGALLEATQGGIDIMDRQDIELLSKENTLQWMVKGQADTGIRPGQAALVGELLWQKPYGQALLSLRIVSTTTGQIITAPVRIIDLDASLASHLGVAINDIPTTPMLSITADSEKQLSAFSKKLKAEGGACSVTSVDTLDKRYQFAGRILYCRACDQLVSDRVTVLERELLYQIAGEQAVAGKTLDSLLLGTIVISFQADETTDASSPELTVRAVKRIGNTLAAQADVAMSSPKLTIINNLGSSPTQVTPIGSEDELASAVRKTQEQASVATADPLIFTETFRLSDKIKLPEQTVMLLRRVSRMDALFTHFAYDDVYRKPMLESRSYPEFASSVDGTAIFDECLPHLIACEKGNVEAIKADLLAMAILGFPVNDGIYPGPLQIIACEITERYTINRDQTPSANFWQHALGGEDGSSFIKRYYKGLHPVLRTEEPNVYSPAGISPQKGTTSLFSSITDGVKTMMIAYTINTEWAGKFPSTVTVTIDLTPMRDRLYKVKSTKE